MNREIEEVNINSIVKKLIDSGTKELTYGVINNLRRTLDNDDNREHVINAIVDKFEERQKLLDSVADRFLDLFQRKYNETFNTMSLSKFMRTALKYKRKYKLSDEQFDIIKAHFDKRIYNLDPINNAIFPHTNMSNIFGYPTTLDKYENPFNISNPEDFAYLQEIIQIYRTFINVHQHIMIQTLLYKSNKLDLPPEITGAQFKYDKMNKNIHIHPVIAALFLIQCNEIDERMLYASIAHIVNTRYNKQAILTKPDSELLYSMVTDPTDLICDNISSMKDLKHRVEVQVQLWNNVYNLRNGNVYEARSLELLANIDNCRVTNIDNPDILFLSDEGIILRRLFSIFSFRPIQIQTFPILNSFTTNPLNLYSNYIDYARVPFIVYQIPILPATIINPINGNINNVVSDINNYSKTVQMIYQEGILVPKQTIIKNVNGPLIFYIPRKYKIVNSVGEYMYFNNTNMFLPNNLFKNNINNNYVKFDFQIRLDNHPNDDVLTLRSLVYYNILPNNFYIGHKTLYFSIDQNAAPSTLYRKYNPLEVMDPSLVRPGVPAAVPDPYPFKDAVPFDTNDFETVMATEVEQNSINPQPIQNYVTILVYLKDQL